MTSPKPVTVDASIAGHVTEIKSQSYAKYIVDEAAIDRNFGYRIIRQQVGSGKNSLVFKCESAKHPESYCLLKSYKGGKDKIKGSLHEDVCQIMRYVSGKCPQLVSFFDMFYTNDKIYLMCDWSSKGDVLGAIKRREVKLNEEMLKNWTIDLLSAVNFLHSNAIAHRNIAPSCMLITPEMRIKICSLSDAVVYCQPDGTLIKQKWPKFSATANWNQPPEVAKRKEYDPRRADVWAIGATVFWFATGLHPINYRSRTKLTKQLDHNVKTIRKLSSKGKSFVKKMLTFQPSQRPNVAQAVQLEWITGATSPAAKSKAKAKPSDTATTTAEVEQTAETNELQNTQAEPGDAAGPEDTQTAQEAETSGSRRQQEEQQPGAAAETEQSPQE